MEVLTFDLWFTGFWVSFLLTTIFIYWIERLNRDGTIEIGDIIYDLFASLILSFIWPLIVLLFVVICILFFVHLIYIKLELLIIKPLKPILEKKIKII